MAPSGIVVCAAGEAVVVVVVVAAAAVAEEVAVEALGPEEEAEAEAAARRSWDVVEFFAVAAEASCVSFFKAAIREANDADARCRCRDDAARARVLWCRKIIVRIGGMGVVGLCTRGGGGTSPFF
eukprot:Rhum_TRINITY_DN12374_c1_g1::Rhum_TRINITY_DN12374_c1_g1_i1::g.51426::m.51426